LADPQVTSSTADMLAVRSTSFVATPSGKQNDSTFARSARKRAFLSFFRSSRRFAFPSYASDALGGYAKRTRAGWVTPDAPLCGFFL
jgi:hypothetical protein